MWHIYNTPSTRLYSRSTKGLQAACRELKSRALIVSLLLISGIESNPGPPKPRASNAQPAPANNKQQKQKNERSGSKKGPPDTTSATLSDSLTDQQQQQLQQLFQQPGIKDTLQSVIQDSVARALLSSGAPILQSSSPSSTRRSRSNSSRRSRGSSASRASSSRKSMPPVPPGPPNSGGKCATSAVLTALNAVCDLSTVDPLFTQAFDSDDAVATAAADEIHSRAVAKATSGAAADSYIDAQELWEALIYAFPALCDKCTIYDLSAQDEDPNDSGARTCYLFYPSTTTHPYTIPEVIAEISRSSLGIQDTVEFLAVGITSYYQDPADLPTSPAAMMQSLSGLYSWDGSVHYLAGCPFVASSAVSYDTTTTSAVHFVGHVRRGTSSIVCDDHSEPAVFHRGPLFVNRLRATTLIFFRRIAMKPPRSFADNDAIIAQEDFRRRKGLPPLKTDFKPAFPTAPAPYVNSNFGTQWTSAQPHPILQRSTGQSFPSGKSAWTPGVQTFGIPPKLPSPSAPPHPGTNPFPAHQSQHQDPTATAATTSVTLPATSTGNPPQPVQPTATPQHVTTAQPSAHQHPPQSVAPQHPPERTSTPPPPSDQQQPPAQTPQRQPFTTSHASAPTPSRSLSGDFQTPAPVSRVRPRDEVPTGHTPTQGAPEDRHGDTPMAPPGRRGKAVAKKVAAKPSFKSSARSSGMQPPGFSDSGPTRRSGRSRRRGRRRRRGTRSHRTFCCCCRCRSHRKPRHFGPNGEYNKMPHSTPRISSYFLPPAQLPDRRFENTLHQAAHQEEEQATWSPVTVPVTVMSPHTSTALSRNIALDGDVHPNPGPAESFRDILCCGDIHPNPGPSLRVLQWNAQSLNQTKLAELLTIYSEFDVIILSEVGMTPGDFAKLDTGHWRSYGKVRGMKNGGTAILVSGAVGISSLELIVPTLGFVETTVVQVSCADETITFSSVYITPSARKIDAGILGPLALDEPHVLAGDMNCHHTDWDNLLNDDRHGKGEVLSDWYTDAGYTIANDPNVATRTAPAMRTHRPSSPDVTAFKQCRISDWRTRVSHLSDHSYITYTVSFGPDAEDLIAPRSGYRVFYSLKKADWSKYHELVSEKLSCSTRSSDPVQLNRALTDAITSAAEAAIPKGAHSDFNPLGHVLRDPEVRRLSALCDSLAASGSEEYTVAKAERRDLIRTLRRKRFEERVASLDPTESSIWNFARSVDTAYSPPGIATLQHANGHATTDRAKARTLNKHYQSVGGRGPRPPRITGINKNKILPVTRAEFDNSIRKVKLRRACGPDGVLPEFIVNLPKVGMDWLFYTVCRSYRTGTVPLAWRTGNIYPIPKPNKPKEEPASYRPITLTSIVAKVAERVVAERLAAQVEPLLSRHQFGFRRTRTTTDAISTLVDYVRSELNIWTDIGNDKKSSGTTYLRPGYSVGVLFDFTAAFDRVDHIRLLDKLKGYGVDKVTLRWIRNFLTDRSSFVTVNGTKSHNLTYTRGVPQGTILGPILWCIYADDLLKELEQLPPDQVKSVMYADDLTVLGQSSTTTAASANVCKAVTIVNNWSEANNMKISESKTKSITFFKGLSDKQPVAHVPRDPSDLSKGYFRRVEDDTEPEDRPRVLGVTIEPTLKFHHHAERIIKNGKLRVKQLNRIAGASFGPSTHAMRTVYKGYVEPHLLHGIEPIWPVLAECHKKKLHSVQLSALRVVTGLPSSTPAETLFREADCAPLERIVQHRLMLQVEKNLRYPPDDIRHIRTARPFSPPAPVNSQVLTATAVPLEMARKLTETHFSSTSPREPAYIIPIVPPWATHNADRISIGVHTDTEVRIPDNCTPEEEVELRKLRNLTNLETVRRVRSTVRRRRFASEFWTDASCDEGGRQAHGAIIRFHKGSKSSFARRCGPLACSYRGEILTIESALLLIEQQVRADPASYRDRTFLVATDSQSSASALAGGPISCKDPAVCRIWARLLRIADMGAKVHIQFIYSHCGTPRNELADRTAGLILRNSVSIFGDTDDLTPDWITDVSCLLRNAARTSTMPPANAPMYHREQLVGRINQALTPSVPRNSSVKFARLRASESLDYGLFRRRVGLDGTPACRWCCPAAHIARPPLTRDDDEAGTDTDSDTDSVKAAKAHFHSHAPVDCSICRKTFARARNLRRHWDRKHKRLPYPAALKALTSTNPNDAFYKKKRPKPEPRFPGEELYDDKTARPPRFNCCSFCGIANSHINHVIRCDENPNKRGLNNQASTTPPRIQPELVPDPSGPEESVIHLLFDCPALADLRCSFPDVFDPSLALDKYRKQVGRLAHQNHPRVLEFMDKALLLV